MNDVQEKYCNDGVLKIRINEEIAVLEDMVNKIRNYEIYHRIQYIIEVLSLTGILEFGDIKFLNENINFCQLGTRQREIIETLIERHKPSFYPYEI